MTTPEELDLTLPKDNKPEDRIHDAFEKALNTPSESNVRVTPEVGLDDHFKIDKIGIKIHMNF